MRQSALVEKANKLAQGSNLTVFFHAYFFPDLQKNREANREAEMNRAEEEEAEEDRDPVERDEMLRRESRQRKAEVDAEKMLKKVAEAERDNMCEAMWTMSLVNKKSINAAMVDTRDWSKKKARWEREQALLEAAPLAPSSAFLASHAGGSIPGSHWGDAGRRSPVFQGERKVSAAAAIKPAPAVIANEPQDVSSSREEVLVKTPRGQWIERAVSDGGGGRSGGGGGNSGGGRADDAAALLGKRKQAPSSGVCFSFKGKGKTAAGFRRQVRTARPLPPVMAKAAAIAEAEEEKLATAKADGKPAAATSAMVDAMDVDYDVIHDARARDVDRVGRANSSAGEHPKSDLRSEVSASSVAGGIAPVVVVSNDVSRVHLSCSRPLLASNGTASSIQLVRAIRSDPRLLKMRWPGGLVMITAVIKDARGGQGLPGIKLTQSPTKLIVEALGAKVTIASDPELENKDGFAAACSGPGVNSVKHLREHLRKLDCHVEEHARGGDEGLRCVDNLREKRMVLEQVGEILGEDYKHLSALGGVWMAVSHSPKVRGQSSEWVTGTATPTVEIRVLMRRARLSDEGELAVEEDKAYAEKAVEMAAAKTAAAIAHVPEEIDHESNLGASGIGTVHDYIRAVGDKIYDGQVREVVAGVVDGMVQRVMLAGGKPADLRDVVMWRAEESKRIRLADWGSRKSYTRVFSLED